MIRRPLSARSYFSVYGFGKTTLIELAVYGKRIRLYICSDLIRLTKIAMHAF